MSTSSAAAERSRAIVAAALLLALATPARAQVIGPALDDGYEAVDDGAPSDAWLTTKVKAALVLADGVPWASVHVDTVDALVTLHGSVASPGERVAAEAAARGVRGMREVRNLLQVVPEPARAEVEVADEVLAERVAKALAADAALADSQLEVRSVNKGVVLLSGTAKSLSDHLRALEDAASVAGVKRVASQIRSPARFVDSELWHDGSFDLDLSKRSSAADLWVTSAVKQRLLAANLTPSYGINVDTRAGVVTLFGVVDSKPARDTVLAEVRDTRGVRKVVDRLQIVPPARDAEVAETDEVIHAAIAQRIEASRALEGSRVVVEVKNRVVRLSGPVADAMERLTVLTLARTTRGVRGVVDELELPPRARNG